eukprot:11374623-Heterocapsa_arctica.AAC.1
MSLILTYLTSSSPGAGWTCPPAHQGLVEGVDQLLWGWLQPGAVAPAWQPLASPRRGPPGRRAPLASRAGGKR